MMTLRYVPELDDIVELMAMSPSGGACGPEALTLRTDEITHTFAWSGFSGFVESDRQFVLMDRSGEPSVVLPKRGLADPSLVPACRRLLTEHLTAARARRPRRRLTAPTADGLHPR